MRNADITDIIDKPWREFKKDINGVQEDTPYPRSWKFYRDGIIEDTVWYGVTSNTDRKRLKWEYDPHHHKIYIFRVINHYPVHGERAIYGLYVDEDILVLDSITDPESKESKAKIFCKRV